MSATIDWGYDAARLGAISFTLTDVGGGGATGCRCSVGALALKGSTIPVPALLFCGLNGSLMAMAY
jgi:hypothetical protein